MRQLFLYFLFLSTTAQAQWGTTGGALFRLYTSGNAIALTDSVRLKGSSTVALARAGNEVAFSASGGATVASARSNTGWTTQGGVIAQDTVVQRIEWGGQVNTSVKIFSPGGDTIVVQPGALNALALKDGGATLFAIDTLGIQDGGHPFGAMYVPLASFIIPAIANNTWTKLTGLTVETSPAAFGMTAVADSFTVTKAGTYEVNAFASFNNNTSTTLVQFELAFMINQVKQTNYAGVLYGAVAATTFRSRMAISRIFTAAGGDDVSLIVRNTTNTDDPAITTLTFTLKKIN